MTAILVVTIVMAALSVLMGLAVITATLVVERRRDGAPPNNRVVGSDKYRHNRIYD